MSDKDAEIFALKAKGKTYKEISEALGIDPVELRERFRDAAADLRRRLADVAEERALVADYRIEWLLEKLAKMIDLDADSFDEKKWKTFLALLERQAKMFGYDKQREVSKDPARDAFAAAKISKLREYARDLGLTIPETFSDGDEE